MKKLENDEQYYIRILKEKEEQLRIKQNKSNQYLLKIKKQKSNNDELKFQKLNNNKFCTKLQQYEQFYYRQLKANQNSEITQQNIQIASEDILSIKKIQEESRKYYKGNIQTILSEYLNKKKQVLQSLNRLNLNSKLYSSHKRVILKEFLEYIRNLKEKQIIENHQLEQNILLDEQTIQIKYQQSIRKIKNLQNNNNQQLSLK